MSENEPHNTDIGLSKLQIANSKLVSTRLASLPTPEQREYLASLTPLEQKRYVALVDKNEQLKSELENVNNAIAEFQAKER